MISVFPPRRPHALALLTVVLALGLTLAGPAGAGVAQADTNYGEGSCVTGYNHADPDTGYLYAATHGVGECTSVTVNIYNKATLLGGPGFEDSYCTATQLWASLNGNDIIAVFVQRHVSLWETPCSGHYGSGLNTMALAGLYFLCEHSGCWQPAPPKQ